GAVADLVSRIAAALVNSPRVRSSSHAKAPDPPGHSRGRNGSRVVMTPAKAAASFVRALLRGEKDSASPTAAVLQISVRAARFRLGTAGSVHHERNGNRAKMLGHLNGKNGSRAAMTLAKAVASFVRVRLQAVEVRVGRTGAAPASNEATS